MCGVLQKRLVGDTCATELRNRRLEPAAATRSPEEDWVPGMRTAWRAVGEASHSRERDASRRIPGKQRLAELSQGSRLERSRSAGFRDPPSPAAQRRELHCRCPRKGECGRLQPLSTQARLLPKQPATAAAATCLAGAAPPPPPLTGREDLHLPGVLAQEPLVGSPQGRH